jgi:hypothetical protein
MAWAHTEEDQRILGNALGKGLVLEAALSRALCEGYLESKLIKVLSLPPFSSSLVLPNACPVCVCVCVCLCTVALVAPPYTSRGFEFELGV